MENVINLRRARKQKARAEKDAAAETNRVQFGRSKSEKTETKAENARAKAQHEAHKRAPAAGDKKGGDENG